MGKHIRKRDAFLSSSLLASTLALALVAASLLPGCGMDSVDESAQNAVTVAQTTFQIEKNAVNEMANGAMKMTVTDVQRRPTSIFSGSSIQGGSSLDGTSESQVGNAASNDIAIQVDVSYTWNANTYMQALASSTSSSNAPSTLGEVLIPGTLMYVTGNDADGNPYMSADIITPAAQEDVNALAINAQWDYDVLNSSLPETSVTKTGSFLIRVPSTVDNLVLVIVTPMGGQALSEDEINTGTTYMYELPLA